MEHAAGCRPSWSRARFVTVAAGSRGDHIPGAIESAVSAGATLHELGPFSASLHLRSFGPRPLVEDDAVRSTASALFNAQVSWQVVRWAKASIDVFNLLDAQVDDVSYFYVSRLRGEPAAGVAEVHLHPAEPRSFRVTLGFTS